jgi:SlyX protein
MHDEQRIDELETRLAHQDQAILELSDEIYEQQKQIARLELQCRELVERIESLAGGDAPTDAGDEKPPHY